MNKTIKFLPLLATGLLAVGCQDYDAGFTEADIKTKQYADKFVQEFGQVDPNQDWSMATLVEANVDLPELQGTAKMNIMTGDPRLSSTRLLAQIMLKDGQGQIKFDAIKGQSNVFVTVEQDGQYKVFGQYAIENGMLNMGKFESLTRALTRATGDDAACPVTLDGGLKETSVSYQPSRSGDKETGFAIITYDPYNTGTPTTKTFEAWKQDAINLTAQNYQHYNDNLPFAPSSILKYDDDNQPYYDWSNWELRTDMGTRNPIAAYGIPGWTESGKVNFQYMNGVVKEATEPITRATLLALMGHEGFFREYVPYWGNDDFDKTSLYGTTDADKLETMKKIEKGFTVKTATTGPVSVPFLFGATSNQDQFGYIFTSVPLKFSKRSLKLLNNSLLRTDLQ